MKYTKLCCGLTFYTIYLKVNKYFRIDMDKVLDFIHNWNRSRNLPITRPTPYIYPLGHQALTYIIW